MRLHSRSMTEPLVGVVMGSASDWETMRHCADQLRAFDVPVETLVLSAHRTPDELATWIRSAEERGVRVFIAAAGMAAALPGVLATQMLGLTDPGFREAVIKHRSAQTETILGDRDPSV